MYRDANWKTCVAVAAILLAAGAAAARAQDEPTDEEKAVNYRADLETINDYAVAVFEFRHRLHETYTAAIANVETTLQQESEQAATADVMGAAMKSGLKTIQKQAIGAIKEAVHVDVGPAVEMFEAIDAEIERAKAAGISYGAGVWLRNLRTAINEWYAHSPTIDQMKHDLEAEYNAQDGEGGRGGWIGEYQIALEGMRAVVGPDGQGLPSTNDVTLAMYEGYLWDAYTHCSGDPDSSAGRPVQGLIRILFDSDGALETVKVVAPLGDRIQSGIKELIGSGSVLGVKAYKQVCFYGEGPAGGWSYDCACVDKDNATSGHMLMPANEEKFQAGAWKDQVGGFKSE